MNETTLSQWFVAGFRPPVRESYTSELEPLAAAIRKLPDRCRQVMTLRLVYGLSHEQIAGQLGLSSHTVKALMAKGMGRCALDFGGAKRR